MYQSLRRLPKSNVAQDNGRLVALHGSKWPPITTVLPHEENKNSGLKSIKCSAFTRKWSKYLIKKHPNSLFYEKLLHKFN